MKQGIRMLGEAGVDAVKKVMQQLHDRKVMKDKHPNDLTYNQKEGGAGIFNVPEEEDMQKRRCCITNSGNGGCFPDSSY